MSFSHLDEGTAEEQWLADPRLHSLPLLESVPGELIVVAAHPDDETLGAGGLMRRAAAEGARVSVIVATDGEASHPESPTHEPDTLRAKRRLEVIEAVSLLAPSARVQFLSIPDGEVDAHASVVEHALAAALDATDATPTQTMIVSPWSGDGHRDHRAVARAVRDAASPRGVRYLGYPIWMWHWATPDDVPWSLAHAVRLTEDERVRKVSALRAHMSQVQALSSEPGDEAIVPPRLLAHFTRDREVFLDEAPGDEAATLRTAFFEDFYDRHDDPWGFETRWYEERKRAVLLAALPTRRLGSVLEIGCATGLLTAPLAARSDRVLALDASERAVDRARNRLASADNVTVSRAHVPTEWPEGTFDAVVLSEVGYYFDSEDLDALIRRIDAALTDDGIVVACHWRHPVAEYPSTGDRVHHTLRRVPGWRRTVLHEEDDFVLEVFGRGAAESVAAREGLT
ncbi:PIG-L family deacetylase [Microbacterium sp. F2]|uniref:PIG-L family deacetylase n=1 Tax=Microbacterium sp. F2 TaxID=3422228 RepID=UPI003FD64F4C